MKHRTSWVINLSLLFTVVLLAWSWTRSHDYLAAPKGVKVVDLTDHSVAIEWRAVENATHYRVSFESTDKSGGGVRSDNHYYYDMLDPGTTYHFKVRAEDETRTRPVDGGYYPLYSDWTELNFTTPI